MFRVLIPISVHVFRDFTLTRAHSENSFLKKPVKLPAKILGACFYHIARAAGGKFLILELLFKA